ncbi:hypothetical protein ACQZ3W_13995 [Ralstonia pseudosolanacearum]
MLCDAGKLGDVIVAEDGRRRVRASAVDTYLAAQGKLTEDAASSRDAGVEARQRDRQRLQEQSGLKMLARPIALQRCLCVRLLCSLAHISPLGSEGGRHQSEPTTIRTSGTHLETGLDGSCWDSGRTGTPPPGACSSASLH